MDPKDEKLHSDNPRRHLRPYVIGAIACILLVLFLLGYVPRLRQSSQLQKEASAQEVNHVTVFTAEPNKKPIELILPSSLQAIRITPLWSRSNGYLSNFYVDIGDRVKEGQLLAVIDTPEVEQQYEQAKSDLINAIARLEIAQISNDRWQKLYATNSEAVSKQEVDQRKSDFDAALASVNASKSNVNRLEKILSFNNIVAPFNGTIIERDVDIGSLITAGSNGNPQQLYRIAQDDILRVFVNVPQPYFRMIHEGVPAQIMVGEYPDRIFKGEVVRTAGALDPVARTLLTEIHVNNKDGALLVGLYADVKFSFLPDNTTYIIPTSALMIRGGKNQVAVVENNDTIKVKDISIGRDFGKTIEIISGLATGDVVVTNPNEKMVNGAKVQIEKH
jgi:RND family efflux transporter MFP subunit